MIYFQKIDWFLVTPMLLLTCPIGQGNTSWPRGRKKQNISSYSFLPGSDRIYKIWIWYWGFRQKSFWPCPIWQVTFIQEWYLTVRKWRACSTCIKAGAGNRSISKPLKLAWSKAHKMVYLVNVYIPFKNFQIQRVVQIVKAHEKTPRWLPQRKRGIESGKA